MDKSDFKKLGRQKLDEFGLQEWIVVFNGRIKRAAGKCRPRKKRIELSETFFVDLRDKIDDELLKDTVLHEVAHAVDFHRRRTSDHSKRWKRVAREVGARPNRTADIPKEVISLIADWKRECPECGWETYYHSKPTADDYICPKCHKDHHSREKKKDYLLDIKPND